MDQFLPAVAATITTLSSIGALYLAVRRWRRWRQAGGPAAEIILNSTLKTTMDAQGAEIGTLRRQLDDAQQTILEMARDFKACKTRLIALERLVADRAIAASE